MTIILLVWARIIESTALKLIRHYFSGNFEVEFDIFPLSKPDIGRRTVKLKVLDDKLKIIYLRAK